MLATLLPLLIFAPLLGGLLILMLPESTQKTFKWISLAISLFVLVASLTLYANFDTTLTGYSYLTDKDWFQLQMGSFGTFDVRFILGIDGVSLSMLLLSGIVFSVASISSFKITKRTKAYHAFYLLLMSSTLGCFISLDFFLFFLFFEFMLLPMYFLIGIWGGKRREYAALKFIIYTLVGSVFILIVMLVMGLNSGPDVFSFDFRKLALLETNMLTSEVQFWGVPLATALFFLLLIGFGIKLPTVPLHTWLPDAHVEAPTAISVVLAGVLLKVGAYGFLRMGIGFFPETATEYSHVIAILGLVSIIYAALNALAQEDLKKLIAYSSISHMGFVFLGFSALNTEGISGAVYQMFSHGLLSSMLFLITGVIYERTGNRLISNYRGLASKMPLFTFVVIVAFFGSLGLPGLSGFIGEFFTLMGSFKTDNYSAVIPSLAVIGIVLSAAYLLWAMQRMFFGKLWVNRDLVESMTDLSLREKIMLFTLAALVLLFGIYPKLIFDITNQSLTALIP
ncbi:NADH dehydrogenase subunit M [Spirosomataceae bacterium TFI 002]|nr:NADH dehydrogenase subunit M [Spirosomataceae bacterium TFI 002]